MDDFVATSMMEPAFGELANARQVLEDWIHGFQDPEEAWASPPGTVSHVAEDTVSYQADSDDEEVEN